MEIKNRNAVLGLETTRMAMVTFLVLAVTGVAIILSLSALTDSVGSTIDNELHAVTNETTGGINQTGYVLDNFGGLNSSFTLTAVWTTNSSGAFVTSVPLTNVSVTEATGLVQNATTLTYTNATVSYTFVTDTQKSDSIFGNVSNGLTTFFGSTGTIFSILIVVVIILAISIIIWAVGRFGQQTEGTVNL